MRIISFIDQVDVIKKILQHLREQLSIRTRLTCLS
jgi:hypothetical protein